MDPQKIMLKIEEKPNYLYVYTSGTRCRETANKLTSKVFNTALEKHLSKILIDIRDLVGDFGFMDIIILVKEGLKDLRGKGVDQVAVIDIHRTTMEGWFLEPVAQSNGINIRVFGEEVTALKWLGE
jgi:hypothetical protein